jgi:DNA-binding XRE family transcriptional regulator
VKYKVTVLLKPYREQNAMTVRMLEAKAGVSKTQIVNIENGSNLPTLPTLCKLAAALKVNPHDMLIFETEKDQVDEQAKG